MIDIESQIIEAIDDAVTSEYTDAYITSVYERSSSQFPCVEVVEMDNRVFVDASDLQHIENAATIVYEINVYSNKATGKKKECRDIMLLIDSTLEQLGFRRTMMNQIRNYADATIYRMVGRWEKIQCKQEEQ